jgi:hypothetical protein
VSEAVQVVAIVVATVLMIGGLLAVVVRDVAASTDSVGGLRRFIEAVVPGIGAAVLLGSVWIWVT